MIEKLSSPDKVVGIKQTKNAILNGEATLVFTTKDADPGLIADVLALCGERGVRVVGGLTRRELARACKIDVPCAAAAVLKPR